MEKAIEIRELRSFGVLVGSILAVIGVLPALLGGEDLRLWALVPAGMLVISALVLPRSLGPVYRVWMAIGRVLGWINTRIILSMVFYGIFVPTGLVRRLVGKDSMRRKLEGDTESYRVVRQPRPSSHMRHQF